ncbi:MAG: TetR/AcrR family transcriptional regulator C-terminal domain-containing protein [Lachnospiraceae bacterium]|nr:TetR/AcrR family transcriptional regulator C-terminal domain-containing protein [Lachnospiraceae bacterium]
MEQKKELTKKLIAQGFKELMEHYPFEKITIKMISDAAGIIRPTFYHHYRDKYELVEWIFYHDVIKEVQNLLDYGMRQEAVKLLLASMKEEQSYYRKIFNQTGQNSFEEVMRKYIYDMLLTQFQRGKIKSDNPILTSERIAEYYTFNLTICIKQWILNRDEEFSIDEMMDAYEFLIKHSAFELMNPDP